VTTLSGWVIQPNLNTYSEPRAETCQEKHLLICDATDIMLITIRSTILIMSICQSTKEV
jgi:hypothetical protein